MSYHTESFSETSRLAIGADDKQPGRWAMPFAALSANTWPAVAGVAILAWWYVKTSKSRKRRR